MSETHKEDPRIEKRREIEAELPHFCNGTEQWYKIYPNVLITDGIKFICDVGEAYWLIDTIFAVQNENEVKNQVFQLYELEVNLETHSAELKVTDGNEKQLYRQEIPYTDFPLPKFKCYYTDNTVLLPSEY